MILFSGTLECETVNFFPMKCFGENDNTKNCQGPSGCLGHELVKSLPQAINTTILRDNVFPLINDQKKHIFYCAEHIARDRSLHTHYTAGMPHNDKQLPAHTLHDTSAIHSPIRKVVKQPPGWIHRLVAYD